MQKMTTSFNAIPKIIHYCWFGNGPLPKLAHKCIASWKKYLPDYEIKEWNETNFDVNILPYTREAYAAHKYAFVSDYARFWILYNYGGIYFDTDVEIIKPLDELLIKGAYMGCERDNYDTFHHVNPGLGIAAPAQNSFYKELLEGYTSRHFLLSNGQTDLTTIVVYTTEHLKRHGLQSSNEVQHIAGITIYTREYFCPLEMTTGALCITDHSYTIHHYSGSWMSLKERIKLQIFQFIMRTPVISYIYKNWYTTLKIFLGGKKSF